MNAADCFCPYVGLQPFSEAERDYFFGRENDARIISSNLYASPLTILYGESGVGKSSILLAAVLPHLRSVPRTAALVFREWQSPNFLDALKAKCIRAVEEAQGKPLNINQTLPLDDLLSEAADAFRGTILILFDQFEEYFLYHGDSRKNSNPFDAEFARAVNREEVEANFLIALREDGLSKLDRFQTRIPNLLTNRLRLHHLDALEAEKAIRGPLDVFNRNFRTEAPPISPEDRLIKEVLSQVRAGKLSMSETSGLGQTEASSNNNRIETPFLQLVMMRLWQEEMSAGSIVLRQETLDRLGGAAQIVKTHLDEEMGKLSDEERRISASMFRYLVTPTGAKIAHGTDDLISFAKGNSDQVKTVLKKLADGRVLRVISPPERYEIFHDVLAPAILDWSARYFQIQDRAEAERRADEQTSAARRLRWLVAGLSLMLLLAVGAMLFGWRQSKRVDEQARMGLARKLAAQAANLSGEKLDLALLLGLEANSISSLPEVKGSLFSALNSSPYLTMFLQYGHTSAVRSVAFSRDGKLLASGSLDKTIMLWNVDDGFPIGPPLKGHSDWVSSVAFSPDGKKLASGGADKNVILWDVSTGQPDVLPSISTNIISCVAFSPDGKELVWSTLDGSIFLWDVEKHQWDGIFARDAKSSVYSLQFSPDGKTLASGDADNSVVLWNVATRKSLSVLSGHTDEIYTVAFSPDGKMLASAGRDKKIFLWDVSTRKQHGSPLEGHIDRVFSLAFSPDGKTLASGSTDKNIILWDVDTGKRRDQSQLVGHVDGVYSLAFSPKPTGALLASGNADGTVTLWDVPPTKWLGRPVVYDESQTRTQVSSVAFTRDGKTLASGGRDLVLWEVSTGKKRSVALPFGSTAESVAFSPDDKTLAAGSMDHDISLWDVDTMKPRRPPLKGHTDWVSSVAFSPDGKTLASGSADKTTVLWNVSTGEREILPLNHTDIVSSVVFSPDGKILASGSWDDTIILWDIENHKILYTLENGPEDGAASYSLAFSPDGHTLASGNDDSISFWNISNGQRSGSTLHKHGGAVKSVAYSLDGRMLASASDDKTIILWDTATNSPLGSPLRESNAPVYSVAFSPDGKLLASGSAMAAARDNWPLILWDMDFESWERRACEIVNRNFIDTSDQREWSQYFPDQDYRATCAIGAIREADADAMKQDDKKASAVFGRAVTIGLHSSDAAINNRICWYGNIDGFPSVVKPACDRAVALATTSDDKNNFGDSRGVGLAMTGHYDEAIQAFERFVKWSQDRDDLKEARHRREGWIKELHAGRNPIDQETRKELRVE